MKYAVRLFFVAVLSITLAACGDTTSEGFISPKEGVSEESIEETGNPEPTPIAPQPEPEPTPPRPSEKVSALIRWTIPSFRINGDDLLLSEIGGYEIIYRRTTAMEYSTVVINDQNLSDWLIENLAPGEYEFLIAAFDTDKLYSTFSNPFEVVLSH